VSGRLCRYLGACCALTLAWAAVVTAAIASRIGDQVAASRDLAQDIAALDGAGAGHALVTRWQDVVSLMLEYRSSLLFEVTLLPPLAVFAAAMLFLAWRRRGPVVTTRPVYSAAVRRVAPSRFM
jgi:hypothetical protein